MASRKKKTISPEGYMKASANAKEVRNKRAIENALRSIKSDTYDANMRYVGGKGGKKAPFVPDELWVSSYPAGMNPNDYRLAGKYAKKQAMDVAGGKAAKVHPWVIEGYKNDALRARDAGDLESAKKLADAVNYFETAKRIDRMDGGGGYRPQRQSRGGQQEKRQEPQTGRAGNSKPTGKSQSGDGWTDPEESNPLKRFGAMVMGNKGVQQTLKAMRMPYSYVASHVSDVAQELEDGDIGGAVGALGRGVGLGVVGETADALKGKGFDIAGVLNSYENEKNRKDFWKQTGVGTYLQRGLDEHTWDDDTILNDKWTKRFIGAAGDFGLDPLTYLTAGTTKLTGTGAQVATRIAEAGVPLAEREVAAAIAKAAASGADEVAQQAAGKLARKEAESYVRQASADVISKGKRVLRKQDIQRLFPEEKVAGGLAWRVPGTGRISRGIAGGLTGGRVVPEEKLIPLLSKNVTNPMQRVLSKPARALGASKLANKMSAKYAGEYGQEIRSMIRSGNPDEVYTGLGVKRSMNMLRSKAAAGVMIDADTIRTLFPEHADKLIKAAGTDTEVGSQLTTLWMKAVAPAIKGREAEILKAVEMGTPDAVEGGREVANFYAAAHRALKKAGVPVGEIPDGQYIPRMFTAEGKEALLAAAEDVPKGTIAHDPKAPFMKHRATLEELGVSNQAEARALLETLYGKGTFETDLYKISSNYMRYADQQLGRKAMLDELVGWGIAHPTDSAESIDDIVKNVMGRKGGRPIPNEPMPFDEGIGTWGKPSAEDMQAAEEEMAAAAGVNLDDAYKNAVKNAVEDIQNNRNTSRLKARLRPEPTGAARTAEEQAIIDRWTEGVSGTPIPASEVLAPEFQAANRPVTIKSSEEIQAALDALPENVRRAHATREAISIQDLRFQRAGDMTVANAIKWGTIDHVLAAKMDPEASVRFFQELGPNADTLAADNINYIIRRHLEEGLLSLSDVRTPTRNHAPKFMDVSSFGDSFDVGMPPRRMAPNEEMQRRALIAKVNDGTASEGERRALQALERQRMAAAAASVESGQMSAKAAAIRGRGEPWEGFPEDPSLPYDPTRFQTRGWVPEKYDGTTNRMAQPFDNFTDGDSQWMGDLLQPNPTNADLERLATAAKDEAGQSAVAALTGEATGQVAMKTYEQAVATRLRHMITDVMEKRVDLSTGEVGTLDDVPLDHLLKEIDASPHADAMYRQLAAIGKRERQAIAFDENAMEGIGHWEDMSDMDKFDPSDSKTWGTNFDPKAVDALESVKAAQSMDPASLQRHLDEINGTIEMLNRAFKASSGAERERIYEELIALAKDEDEFLKKLWSTEPTDFEMGMAGSREESLAQMFRDIERPDFTWQSKTVSRGEFLGEGNLFPYERGASWTTLTKQRNLADVYLGMQRVAAEQATQGVNIGTEQIAALDNLYAVASSVKDVRMELGGSAFSVPSKDAIQREWIALGINTKPIEEIAVGKLGRNARAFYDNTVEQINDALHSVQTMDPEDPIMAETMKNLQRQRVRMSLAVASGKDSEFIRTMLLQSLEGVGGNELSVTQDAIDSVVRAVMDPTADLTSVLDNLVAPSHPMGGPLPPSNARLMRPLETQPRPKPDLYAESVKAQAAWDAKRAGLEQRKRLIIAARDKRGYTTSAEWDEFKALKQELKEMPERPRAAAVQALADTQAQNERLIAEYDHLGAKIEGMKADGRITRYPDGELGAGDDEAKYALARVREIREQNPWEASGRKPEWLMEDADWADVLGGGKIGMPRDANEAKAPWLVRQKEIKAEIKAAKATGDSKAVKKLAAESRKVQRQLDDIARRYGAADESRKVVPAKVGSTASDAEAFYEGSKLAEQRIKQGRADETLAHIRNKLQSPNLTHSHRARLEGGLKRLEEHAATMETVTKPPKVQPITRGGTPPNKASFADAAAQRAANGEQAPFVIVGTGTRQVVKNPQEMEALIAHLTTKIEEAVALHGSVKIVSGGAEGFDEALALAARRAGVPYHLDLPTSTHGDYYWAKNSQTGTDRSAAFKDLFDGAESVEFTEPRPMAKGRQNFTRNTVMMQRGDEVWALPSGVNGGGTKHGMAEARKFGMEPQVIEVPKAASAPQAAPAGKIRSSANIWDDHAAGHYAVIPTNTVVKSNGEAVMGAGLAKQARDKFKGLSARYGAHLRDAQANGTSTMMVDHENRLILVPTKGDWRLPSSVEQVDAALTELGTLDLPMSVPNLGVGNGQVPLADVEALMAKHGIGVPKAVKPPELADISPFGDMYYGESSKPFNPRDEFKIGTPKHSAFGGSDRIRMGPEMVDDYINRKFWSKQIDPVTNKPFASRERYAEHLLNLDSSRIAAGKEPMFLESTPAGARDRARVLGIPEAGAADPEMLADPAPILNGQHDDELVARLDAQAKDPAAAPQARRTARDTRNWVQNKQRRVIAAVDSAGGDSTAEAAIAAQSQAENAGAERFLRYPTSDPTRTFKQLNKLTTVRNLAKLAEDQGSRIVWLQKSQGLVTDSQVAELLNQVATVSTPEGMRNFLGYYDKFMTYVKAWQLTTPGFHVRNLMGGIFNNYLAGVELGATSRFMRKIQLFKAGKLEGEEAEWMKVIYENVGGGQYSHHEIGVAASIKPSKNPFSPRYGPLRASAAFGGDVEFRLRGALMWDRLSKGKGLQEALDDVTRYHFDYSNLSNFETNAVKRIVPFYVWTRYNFPLQMEMMATTPNKYRYYQQFKRAFEDKADSGKPVPSFLTNEMFGIPLPMHSGKNQMFFTPDLPMTRTLGQALPDAENWNPKKLGTYPTLLDPYFSQMAVPLKLPAELALSRQFFKGIPIRDTQNTEGYIGTKGPMKPVANFIGGKAKTDYLLEQLMPFYGQGRRIIPAEGKHKDRRITNWLSYVGLPIRTNTPRDQENELMRRQYMEK